MIPSGITGKPYDSVEVMNSVEGKLTGIDCEKCRNKGVIYFWDGIYEKARDCECMEVRQSIKRIERSGLKDALKQCTFQSFCVDDEFQSDMKSKALKYIEDFNGKWFFAGGQVGCGKTHICTAIVHSFLVGMKKPAKYMQWRDEIPKIKSKANSDEYERLLKLWKTVKVLYIDDLFKTEQGQKPTIADVNISFEILNYRYRNPDLITVISSEKTIREIVSIDEAVGSRIFEKSKEYCINIGKDVSKNYRLKGIAQ